MKRYRILKTKPHHMSRHTPQRRRNKDRLFYEEESSDSARYSEEMIPYYQDKYQQETSEEERVIKYVPFYSKKSQSRQNRQSNMSVPRNTYPEFSPVRGGQRKQFKISKMRPVPKHRLAKKPKPVYVDYESNTDQEVEYTRTRHREIESTDSEVKAARPPRPIRNVKQEGMSSLSIPIIEKANIMDFQIEIEQIVASDTPNKKKMIWKVFSKLNRSLILSIDSFVSFLTNENEDKINGSFDSQMSQTLEVGRIHNNQQIIELWRNSQPQFTLNSTNLNAIYYLVQTY